ncbi:hypothetical protein GCM10010315_30360 [Streptomyces luteosporeus]|uniref:Uncharacterized protein n=1 Tax=Streptomyces luteosporeus TaxID=173856 RepID=A0ABN3TR19_9ACTN
MAEGELAAAAMWLGPVETLRSFHVRRGQAFGWPVWLVAVGVPSKASVLHSVYGRKVGAGRAAHATPHPHLVGRHSLYRWTAEISPPGRSSCWGGVLIGRP